MVSLKQARRLLQPKMRKGQAMSDIILIVIIIVLAVAVIAMLFLRSMSTMNAIGTASGSATLASDGSLLLTVSAEGGKVTIAGIVLDSPTGVVATVGTTPGYSSGSSSSTCSLTAVYIGGAQGSTTAPWVLQNGKAASFTFKPSSTGGCSDVTTVLVFYNSGKVLQISVG
jgi:hypothetical protein